MTEQVSFLTVPVILVNGRERRRVVALLDPASSASYVKEEVAKQLRLSGPSHRLEVSVIGGANVSGMRQNVKVTLESVEGGLTADFDAWVVQLHQFNGESVPTTGVTFKKIMPVEQ